MKKSTALILTTLLAAASFGATASTTLPTTTQASAAPAPTTNPYLALRGMSADYIVLTNRSIFKKGSQMTDPFAPTTPLPPPRPQPYTPAESSLEFNGAMHADASWTAFFENTSNHDVFVKHEGDNIARGKITAITLDSIDYETNGRQNTIALGHTLDGSEGPGLASAPSLSLSSTQPSANFSGPNADVLERLRQKRLKELGQ
jgi:hypothetical protein